MSTNSGLLQSEERLSTWSTTSVIMLGTAILLYHSTNLKKPTIKMPVWASLFVVVSLIILDIGFSLSALIPYIQRSIVVMNNTDIPEYEKHYFIMYSVLIGFLIIIQLVICYYLITDSLWRIRK